MVKLFWAAVAAFGFVTVAVAVDQAHRPTTTYKAPRTPNGHPDLEGVWSNGAITRLERNPRHGDTLVLTEEQVRKFERRN